MVFSVQKSWIFHASISVSQGVVVVLILTTMAIFLPQIGNTRSLVMVSGSMEPVVPTGSVIYVSRGSYNVSDVITFQKSGNLVTHRIVGIENLGGEVWYRTRGDANRIQDFDLVNSSTVIGKHIFTMPYIGFIPMVLSTPLGFVAGIVLPTMTFFLMIALQFLSLRGMVLITRSHSRFITSS